MVDDCHATGLIGPGGRGTQYFDVVDRVDIVTSTLGKASVERWVASSLPSANRRPAAATWPPVPVLERALLSSCPGARGDSDRFWSDDRERLMRRRTLPLRDDRGGFDPGAAHPIVP